jgi:malonate-semialdehyde dehydrogenase (acetylating)/methylmalonate-semialdehyde dehydrogenase
LDVLSPLHGFVISTVPLSTYTDLDTAVAAAKEAYTTCIQVTLKERFQIFFRS